MGTSVKVPGPSEEERALQRNQAELLALQREIIEAQQRQQAVLVPFFAEQEGFSVEVDDLGNITSISKVPTELENIQKEVELGLAERSLAALKGELPVSPGLERELGKQEETLRERLRQQFGPGFETSSPGIETLDKFFTSAEVLREGARTGQLTLAEQLGIARDQQNNSARQTSQDILRQVGIGDPLTFAGAFGQTAQGFGAAQQPFIRQRELQLQASIANAQSGNPFGQIAGTVFGSLFSDRRLKTEIEPIGVEVLPGLPLVEFKFTFEGKNAPRRIGLIAQDVERVCPEAVYELGGYKCIDQEYLEGFLNMVKLNPFAGPGGIAARSRGVGIN